MAHEGHFTVLDTDECRHLLRGGKVGRISWSAGEAGQLILPVNYVVADGTVLFRTSPHAVLAQLSEGCEVAFQVDDYDESAANGWSVLVQGHTELYGEERLNPVPDPWAPGQRNLVIAVVPRRYSGRAVSAKE